MSSFSSLNIGYSALVASQRAVDVAAHNVANAGTAGFTRQRLEVHTATPTEGTPGVRGDGMRGMGVSVVSVGRLRDALADVSWRSEAGVEGAASTRADGLGRTEAALGTYASGAPEALSSFVAAWDGLSLNPADSAARSTVVATGQALADSLRSSSQGLDQVASELGTRVGNQVGELNGLLDHVKALNAEIQRARAGGSDPNDLLDDRDSSLDRVVQLTGATLSTAPDGDAEVSLGTTPLLKDRTVDHLATSGSGTDLVLSSESGSTLTLGGQMGGNLSLLRSDLPAYRSDLNALAVGLRDTVNAIHRTSKDLTGANGTDFFTGTGAADLTVAVTSTTVAASRSGNSSDGEGALAMDALRTQAAVGGANLGAAMRAFSARVGQAVTDATRNAKTARSGLDAAALTRASSDGVSVDEEMVDLVKYQHSYSAASRVITTIDAMLDQVINRMGSH